MPARGDVHLARLARMPPNAPNLPSLLGSLAVRPDAQVFSGATQIPAAHVRYATNVVQDLRPYLDRPANERRALEQQGMVTTVGDLVNAEADPATILEFVHGRTSCNAWRRTTPRR